MLLRVSHVHDVLVWIGKGADEIVYRSLYYYTKAYQRGEATDLPAYYAAHAKLLGIVKHKRKSAHPPILTEILALTSEPVLNL